MKMGGTEVVVGVVGVAEVAGWKTPYCLGGLGGRLRPLMFGGPVYPARVRILAKPSCPVGDVAFSR
ncbi:hypothetical protein E2C01_071584 [Portunus trituberculatus]|uniref:Uncharacterized protein n=1 Tax=Portunus trituberculatus TaxID=210409 RepID=A0A5B7I8D4_PORTR|nr:hypothetical protein [Portunus trituberculatus]